MKNQKTHWQQVNDGKTKPTKRERKALFGFGVSGNSEQDRSRHEKQMALRNALDSKLE